MEFLPEGGLDIERQRLSAAIATAQARAQLTQSYIAVNKALGLGWAADAALTAVSQPIKGSVSD